MKPTQDNDSHLVFGAGLIGGFVAGGLLHAGYPVNVVARPKVRQAMAQGLKLTDYLQHETLVPAPGFVESDANQAPLADILWLTVKCTGVENALPDMAAFVGPDTVIICCQNGFGSDQAVRQHFPANKILGAVIGYNVAEPAPGHLHRSTEGKLVIEDHQDLPVGELVTRLNCGVFPAELSHDFHAAQWAKLQLNLANAINALADVPVKTMIEQRGFRRIIARLMQEMLNVTDALELDLPKVSPLPAQRIPSLLKLPNFAFKLLAQKMLAIDPSARTSMWWDLTQGKQTEIDFLNGSVVTKARELGLTAPLNQAVVELVHAVERGDQTIGFTATELGRQLDASR
jgi:2-dehydropantoate 2-reductase